MRPFTDMSASLYSAKETLMRKASVFKAIVRELEYKRQYNRRMLARAVRNASNRPNTHATARALRNARNFYEREIENLIAEEKKLIDDFKILVRTCGELHATAK